MTTVYALTSIYLRETTKVFTFPVSFKVIAVCASYTVGGEKKGSGQTLRLTTK